MQNSRLNSHERKRGGNGFLDASMASSSSSYANGQHTYSASAPPSQQTRYGQRSPSPPASTYFPFLAADQDRARLQPVPDAESHFAYSTTLRRHHVDGGAEIAQAVNAEATSIWTRFIAFVTGEPQQRSLEDGRRPSPVRAAVAEERKDTVSAKFAHASVEVSLATLFKLLSRGSSEPRTQ